MTVSGRGSDAGVVSKARWSWCRAAEREASISVERSRLGWDLRTDRWELWRERRRGVDLGCAVKGPWERTLSMGKVRLGKRAVHWEVVSERLLRISGV